MQLDESGHLNARRTQLHPRAGDRIQHPRRYCNDHAWRDLDVNNMTDGALLGVMLPYTMPVERVPAVMDLHFPADMGRMTG